MKVSSQAKHMPDLLAYLHYELKQYVPAPIYEDDIFRLPEEIPDDTILFEGSKRKITVG